MVRPVPAPWAGYRIPAGEGPVFVANMTIVPPPFEGAWTRVPGGWYRESPPQPAEQKSESQDKSPRQADQAIEASEGKVRPMRPLTEEERVRQRERDRRRRGTAARREYMRRYMGGGYLKRWREKHPRRGDPYRVSCRWARAKGDVTYHLAPVVGDLRRRPTVPGHRLCRLQERVARWSCPPAGCKIPEALKCGACLAAKAGWLLLVSDGGRAEPAPRTAEGAAPRETWPTVRDPEGTTELFWSEANGLRRRPAK